MPRHGAHPYRTSFNTLCKVLETLDEIQKLEPKVTNSAEREALSEYATLVADKAQALADYLMTFRVIEMDDPIERIR